MLSAAFGSQADVPTALQEMLNGGLWKGVMLGPIDTAFVKQFNAKTAPANFITQVLQRGRSWLVLQARACIKMFNKPAVT